MDYFDYRSGQLHAEDVSLEHLAQSVGTPFYCYSHATLVRHYQVFCEGLSGLDFMLCYAVKANSNLSVLSVLRAQGSGADVVSEGEIRRALAAGVPPERIIFSGVGKTRSEMAYALEQKIYQFNVESEPELLALQEVAKAKGVIAPIALRINPDVDAGTHAKISTGKQENKFGVPLADAQRLYALAATLPNLKVQGVSMHIGSQLTRLEPFREAYARARAFVLALRDQNIHLSTIDIGGGLGIPYEQSTEPPPSPELYGAVVREAFGDLGCRIIVEPGRLIVGNAGVLVSRVIYVKRSGERTFVIVDAAMNDLIRPSLYDAYHHIVPVQAAPDVPLSPVDIVGPVCETGDSFAASRPMPPLAEGDLIAFRTAGAYGAVMANHYNSRLLVPEVMVKGAEHAIIRPRPSYDDLLAHDRLAPWCQ